MSRKPTRRPPTPYADLERTALWKAIDRAIADLEKNQDLILTTGRDYVVGYICRHLTGKIGSDPIPE